MKFCKKTKGKDKKRGNKNKKRFALMINAQIIITVLTKIK